MLLRLVTQLQEQGVTSIVISLSKREPLAREFEKQGVSVFTLDMTHVGRIGKGLKQLHALLAELAPDVVQGWMYHANLVVSVVAPFLQIRAPVVWNIRRGLDDYGERKISTRAVIRLNAILSSRADRIVYCTHESRVQHEAFGFSSRPGVVVGNGFDTTLFAPNSTTRAMIRDRLGVATEEILIGNIGRDDSAKGRAFLLEAFADLVQRVPHARLLLVGRGMDESNRELRGRLVASRIASRVILMGEYSPISDLYPAMDILCSSSVSEGFPNVIAEAMASGVPCVATDTGNTAALLQGRGLVVPTRSGLKLAEALRNLCEESAEQRCFRGRLGRERIITAHSLRRVVDDYVSLYREVSGRVSNPSDLQQRSSSEVGRSTVLSRP
jgi:glycosyltransferase involved in cell wall biosynthesis